MSDRFDMFLLQDPCEFAQAMQTTEQALYDQEKAGHLISVLPSIRECGRVFPGFQQRLQLNAALHRKAIALYRSRGLDMTIYWDFLRTRHAAFGGATGVEVLLDLTDNSALRELPPHTLAEVFLETAEEDMHRATS
ncbi:MAG: hypothetical protein GXD23_13125 [Comamonadaceae bacterium]|jgi:hypothetical protein|nr:hypothetical protein [Comamonadaceae bacterium]